MFKCNAFPLLDTYEKARAHFENVKPMVRGEYTGVKPIHLRSRPIERIMRDGDDVVYVSIWGTNHSESEMRGCSTPRQSCGGSLTEKYTCALRCTTASMSNCAVCSGLTSIDKTMRCGCRLIRRSGYATISGATWRPLITPTYSSGTRLGICN